MIYLLKLDHGIAYSRIDSKYCVFIYSTVTSFKKFLSKIKKISNLAKGKKLSFFY
jgi:hypothetical protein